MLALKKVTRKDLFIWTVKKKKKKSIQVYEIVN